MLRPFAQVGKVGFLTRCFSSSLPDIIVTASCAERISSLATKAPEPLRLRLAVEGGGCSGFSYNFDLEPVSTELDSSDKIFERNGSVVVVDDGSLEFVRGSTIDFSESMIRSAFVVSNNPNSDSACGCGSSFALKQFSQNPALD